MAGKSQERVAIIIRIPKPLHQKMVGLAKRDTRSLNGEIEAALAEFVAKKE